MKTNRKGNHSRLVIFTISGLSIALVIFLFVFITTQKAATPYKYRNLKIPLISPPPRVIIPPLPTGINFTVATPSSSLIPSPTTKIELEEEAATGSMQTETPEIFP